MTPPSETSIKQIPAAQPYFGNTKEAIIQDIQSCLDSGNLTQGPHLEHFENDFKSMLSAKYAIGLSSGGTALELVLKSLGVKGKEVIVPTNTFVATANAVTLAGAHPVFVDINQDTLCLCTEDLANKISHNTVGVIYVHMFGLVPPDFSKCLSICKEKKIFLIEDAAHAHGAKLNENYAGNLADAGCFSFYPSKIMTTGEGGMVVTNNDKLQLELLRLRNHGKSLDQPLFEVCSNNYRLAEVPAIIGKHQLKILPANISRRNEIAQQYRIELSSLSALKLLPTYNESYHSYWRFPAYLDSQVDRPELQKEIASRFGVRITWMYEPACHLQPVFARSHQHKPGDFPVAEKALSRLICLPCHPGVSDSDIKQVCKGLEELL